MTDPTKPTISRAAMERLRKLSRDFRLPTNRRYAAMRLETALDALTVVDELPARERLLELLRLTIPVVTDDALVQDAISRHAPLPDAAQAAYDAGENTSAVLLARICEATGDTYPLAGAPDEPDA